MISNFSSDSPVLNGFSEASNPPLSLNDADPFVWWLLIVDLAVFLNCELLALPYTLPRPCAAKFL